MLARLSGIALTRGGRRILDGVDLTIAAGEIVMLIGPNGAGKTTLLRVLLGLSEADSGERWLRANLRMGYMPQSLRIDETLPLTVGRFVGLARPAMVARIGETLAECGIAKLAEAPIQGLSGGEFRRALLARALLRDPDLLVLDEPVQGVDVMGQGDLFKLIVSIRDRRRCAILMVSHDLHLVMAATDRVICLNQHICCSGVPEAVSRHPAYLALFGERAASLAVYSHHHDHEHDVTGRAVPAAEGRRHEHG